jgi:hypothetical protein
MAKLNLSREYLFSDELKREFEALVQRIADREDAEKERRERQRRRLQRLTFGLLGG